MRHSLWILLLVVTGPGCFTNPFVAKDKNAALPKLPSAPVTAEEINARNAHEMALRAADECDSDELGRKKN